MNQSKLGQLTFAVLDYERPKETLLCIESIKRYCSVNYQLMYVCNGGSPLLGIELQANGHIDTLIVNKNNWGCGIGMKQCIQSSMTDWVIIVQSDQIMNRPFIEDEFNLLTSHLAAHPETFYMDLAGNQGHGRYSERAGLINRAKYLGVPWLEDTIGGPGPYANSKWTEQLIQEYITEKGMTITSANPLLFADNGKWSQRSYPCGGETKHSTDERRLFILKSLARRYDDFPNLKLNDEEWRQVLAGEWPKEGKVPEADKPHSFIYWKS